MRTGGAAILIRAKRPGSHPSRADAANCASRRPALLGDRCLLFSAARGRVIRVPSLPVKDIRREKFAPAQVRPGR